MANGDPIIIKGGSIEVVLYKDTFPPDAQNPHRHFNAERKITGLKITDHITKEVTSVPIPAGGDFTISIEHR